METPTISHVYKMQDYCPIQFLTDSPKMTDVDEALIVPIPSTAPVLKSVTMLQQY
jgi:hypothetical protein